MTIEPAMVYLGFLTTVVIVIAVKIWRQTKTAGVTVAIGLIAVVLTTSLALLWQHFTS